MACLFDSFAPAVMSIQIPAHPQFLCELHMSGRMAGMTALTVSICQCAIAMSQGQNLAIGAGKVLHSVGGAHWRHHCSLITSRRRMA